MRLVSVSILESKNVKNERTTCKLVMEYPGGTPERDTVHKQTAVLF